MPACKILQLNLMTRLETTDLCFADARAHLLELAAFLDRVERGEGTEDFRMESLRTALHELDKPGADRAKRILMLLSDRSKEPVPGASSMPVRGAWAGFDQ